MINFVKLLIKSRQQKGSGVCLNVFWRESYKRLYSTKANKSKGVKTEQANIFTVWESCKRYPGKLLKNRYVDAETQKEFNLLTNNFELRASGIAALYKTGGK
jgi:hypothetical protein